MSTILKATAVIACCLFVAGSNSFAQSSPKGFEVGINAGTLIYQGDLSKSYLGSYSRLKPSIGVYFSKPLDNYFSLRGNLTFGKTQEDDAWHSTPEYRQYRNLNFKTRVNELSATVVFNPFGENTSENFHAFSPYVFGGLGATFLKVNRDWSNINTTAYDVHSSTILGLGLDTIHATPRVIAVLPVGVGLKYAINSQLSVYTEANYRFARTDYLDGFKYVANPNKRDSYYGLSIGLSYKFGNDKYKCPVVKP